jgi:hypothetical protein
MKLGTAASRQFEWLCAIWLHRRTNIRHSEEKKMAIPFCPGYNQEPFATLIANYPG